MDHEGHLLLNSKAHRQTKLVQLLVVLGVVLFVVFAGWSGLASKAWDFFTYQNSARGSCRLYEPQSCRSLTLETIEQIGDVALPKSAVVLDSGTVPYPHDSLAFGIVEVPADKKAVLESSYKEVPVTGGPSKILEDLGLIKLSYLDGFASVDEAYRSISEVQSKVLLVGTGKRGEQLILVQKFYGYPSDLFNE